MFLLKECRRLIYKNEMTDFSSDKQFFIKKEEIKKERLSKTHVHLWLVGNTVKKERMILYGDTVYYT